MREAVGGTMLMYIVVVFLIVYIIFMSVVINYGRVFRVKNALISKIENDEGINNVEDLIGKAADMGYVNQQIDVCYTPGNNNYDYYSVRVYIYFGLPMVSNGVVIPISGQTSAIKRPKGKSNTNAANVSTCNTSGDKWQGVAPITKSK